MGRKEIKENSGHSGEKTKNRSGKIRSGNSTKKRKSRPMRVKGKIRTDQLEIRQKNKQTKQIMERPLSKTSSRPRPSEN